MLLLEMEEMLFVWPQMIRLEETVAVEAAEQMSFLKNCRST